MRVGLCVAMVLSLDSGFARGTRGGMIDSSDPPTTGHWGVKLDAGGPTADRTYSVPSTGSGAGSGQGGFGGSPSEDEWAWNRVTPPIPGTIVPGTEQPETFAPPTLAADLISAVTNPLGSGGSSISPGSMPGTGIVSTVPGTTGTGPSGSGSSSPAGSTGDSDSNGFSNPIGGSNGFGETPGAVLPNPEPASLALLFSGAGLLVLGRKKSRRRPQ